MHLSRVLSPVQLALTPSPLAVRVSTFGVAGEGVGGVAELTLEEVGVERVGFFGAAKGCQRSSKTCNDKTRTGLRRGGHEGVSSATGGPLGLFDVVLPLFHNILRCFRHTLVCMRSQFSDCETGLAFLLPNGVWSGGVALGRRRWMAHPKNGFIYVLLFLQSTQNFHDRLEGKKNAMGQPENLRLNGIILPREPGRFEET